MEKTVYVLWYKYRDGSGQEVVRAYGDPQRAKEDFDLISIFDSNKEWNLTKVPFFGGNNGRSTEGV